VSRSMSTPVGMVASTPVLVDMGAENGRGADRAGRSRRWPAAVGKGSDSPTGQDGPTGPEVSREPPATRARRGADRTVSGPTGANGAERRGSTVGAPPKGTPGQGLKGAAGERW